MSDTIEAYLYELQAAAKERVDQEIARAKGELVEAVAELLRREAIGQSIVERLRQEEKS